MKAQRREMNRNRIMDGACALLNEGHYGALTVNALAATLHMSKSTLYKYFIDKQALVVSVAERACLQTEQEIATHKDQHKDGPAIESFKAVLATYGTHGARLPVSFILERKKLPLAAQRRMKNVRDALDAWCAEVIERGLSEGAFRYKRADLLAMAVQASLAATVTASAKGELEADIGTAVEQLLPLFI